MVSAVVTRLNERVVVVKKVKKKWIYLIIAVLVVCAVGWTVPHLAPVYSAEFILPDVDQLQYPVTASARGTGYTVDGSETIQQIMEILDSRRYRKKAFFEPVNAGATDKVIFGKLADGRAFRIAVGSVNIFVTVDDGAEQRYSCGEAYDGKQIEQLIVQSHPQN